MSSMEMSNCSVWHVITDLSSLHEPEQIADLLTQTKPRLLSGLEFFKRPSAVSAEKVQKAAVIKPLTKQFVSKLSKFLDVDEWQSYELFQHFLQSDFRGSKQQLETTLSSDLDTEGLLLKVTEYYFEERLHILQCLKYLLSYWQDVSHPYKKQFSDSVEALQVDDQLINKIKDQYKSCCLSSVPSSHTASTMLVRARSLRWPLQYLREQILLLEIMLLYYKEYFHRPKNLLELAKLFQSQGFGTRQVNRHLFDARVETLIPQISYLQVLILIVSFDLESLRNRMEQGRYEDHHLLQHKEIIKKLDSLFMSWGDMQEHGPVMLSWAVFRFATTAGTEHEQDVRKIGSKSLQCNVFQFLHNLQLSEHFHGSLPVASTSKNVVYMLMSIVLSFFREDSLGDLQLLTSVLSRTLTEKTLLKDFWSSGLDTGAGLLLNSTRNWFPLRIHPFLELVSSLAGQEDSATKVYEYLDVMPSYTELLKENRVGDVDCTLDEKIWKVMTPKALYKTVVSEAGQLVIPSGTLGRVFQIPEGPVAVRWTYKYSCWKLFVLEIDWFLHSISLGSEVGNSSVVGIVNVVDKILQNDWSKAPQLVPIIARLHLIIQRCTPSPNPPQDLIAACLSCLATVASRDPLQVWFDLQQTGFVPHCTSVKGHEGDKSKIETMSIEAGNFGVILNYKERPIGYYPVTIATLRLFLELLKGIGYLQEREEQPVNFLDLAACEVFILREVFSGFHKWRFTKMEDREQIGQRCLELFNVVLGLHLKQPIRSNEDEVIVKEMETDIRGYSRCSIVLQHVLVHGLLCTEAGGSLLEILGTGVDTIDKMILWGGWTGSHAVALVRLIKLAFSVLNRLLVKRGKGDEISPLEHALSTQVIHQFRDSSGGAYGANLGHSHLVTVIASYVYHRLDSKLPTLAALLLKRLCLVAPMSMYASFGNEAVALRDAYVSRLQNMTEDVRLKIAILDFIATAVESQPGLIELFLNLTMKAGDSQEYQIGPSSCLKAILSVIDPKDQVDHHIPASLVAAAQMLLHALWHDRRDKALVAVRNSPNFWENITKPLFTDISSTDEEDFRYQLDTVSYVLQIVALEAYYVSSGRLDASLKTVLQKFSTKGRYHYWSKFLRRSAPGEETSQDSQEEQLKLLRSWRTFLIVSSSSQLEMFGLRDSSLHLHILRDSLEALKLQVSGPVNGDTMAAASELASLYLMLLTKWKGCIQNENEIFTGLVDVLEFALKNDKQALLRIQVPVFSAISVLLQHTRNERKSHTLDSSYAMALLPVACEPLEYLNGTLQKHGQQLDRVLVMSVLIIDEILSILLANPGQWLPVLREHALFSSLVQALDICIRGCENLEFTEAVLHLFLSLSRINMGAESLALNSVSQPLCLSLASLFSSLDAKREREVSQQRETGTRQMTADPQSFSSYKQWSYVWQLSLAVMASMLRTLRHGFLKEALDFAGVHRERLAQAMDSVRRSQTTIILAEAEEVTAFLFELAHFSSEWRFSLPDVLSLLQLRAGILCQTCIAVLLRPRLLAHLLEMNSGVSIRDGPPGITDVNVTLSGSYSRGLLRSYSTTEDEVIRTNPLVIKTQSLLLKILCNALAMFRHFTPDICQILMDDLMDVEGHTPVVTLAFSSPALDHEEPLSFGTLLACLNMCLTNLSPGDIRSPVRSPVKAVSEILPRHLLMFAVENAVIIALSQASRYLKDPTVDLRVKQLLKRELGSELDNFLGGLFRHFVRRGCPPSPTGARVSPGSTAKRTPNKTMVFTEAPEQQFFKLADTFVKQMLK